MPQKRATRSATRRSGRKGSASRRISRSGSGGSCSAAQRGSVGPERPTHGVPLAGLRGVSDGAEDLRHMDDWKAYLHVIDEKLAAVVDRILAAAD